MTTPAEEHLVKACLNGDREAQRALYEQFKVPMFRLCLRYAKDRHEAEDLLQEGFIRVFSDLHQFRHRGALGGWIRRVMVNVALQHLRRQHRQVPTTDLEAVAFAQASDQDIIGELSAKNLVRFIQQLPPGYRAVFNMYVLEGYSHKEIAEKLGVSVNTSKTQLFKAKAMLRSMLEKSIAS